MKTLLLALAILGTFQVNAFASNGEELFEQKCASCHQINKPADKSSLIAPPLKGFMYHLSEHFKTKQEIKEHINSFVMNPTKETAVCRGVRRFGLMPSQKGLLTKEELNTIAEWMLKFSPKDCAH